MLINPPETINDSGKHNRRSLQVFNSGANWTKVHSVLMSTDLRHETGDTSVFYMRPVEISAALEMDCTNL